MPLPDRDSDVTEVAVPSQILSAAGDQVTFATERQGTVPVADPRLLTGVLFGRLGAADEPRCCYEKLTSNDELRSTVARSDLVPADFDRMILPRGHGRIWQDLRSD